MSEGRVVEVVGAGFKDGAWVFGLSCGHELRSPVEDVEGINAEEAPYRLKATCMQCPKETKEERP